MMRLSFVRKKEFLLDDNVSIIFLKNSPYQSCSWTNNRFFLENFSIYGTKLYFLNFVHKVLAADALEIEFQSAVWRIQMFEIQSVFFGPLFFLQTFRKSIEPIRWEKKPDHVKKRPDGKNANLLIFYRHFQLNGDLSPIFSIFQIGAFTV